MQELIVGPVRISRGRRIIIGRGRSVRIERRSLRRLERMVGLSIERVRRVAIRVRVVILVLIPIIRKLRGLVGHRRWIIARDAIIRGVAILEINGGRGASVEGRLLLRDPVEKLR